MPIFKRGLPEVKIDVDLHSSLSFQVSHSAAWRKGRKSILKTNTFTDLAQTGKIQNNAEHRQVSQKVNPSREESSEKDKSEKPPYR